MLLAGIAIHVVEPTAVARIRANYFDSLQRLHPRTYHPVPVRIVDIDEESLARLGQWPWPRTTIARMVARLKEAGVGATAFDILFAEADRMSPKQLAAQWQAHTPLQRALGELPDNDLLLASAMAEAGNAVTAFALTEQGSNGDLLETKAGFVRMGSSEPLQLSRHGGVLRALPPLEEAARGNGAINFTPDGDGVVRIVPLLFDLDGRPVPGLLSEALRVAAGAPSYTVEARPDERNPAVAAATAVRIGPWRIPTDEQARVRVYLTEPASQRYVPAWRILEDDAGWQEAFPEGAIVFVGSSATGLQDLRFGPLGEILPGVEIHAQLAEQVLLGIYPTRPGSVVGAEILVMFAAWFGTVLFGRAHQTMRRTVVATTSILLLVAMSWVEWTGSLVLGDPVTPSLVIAAVFLVYTVPLSVAAERQERWVRQAFANYLSPNLVEHLVRNPQALKLGGERRVCSFVLTDVASFTTLVENSEPEALTSIVNRYLEGMISIAFRHDGTLDRIVGDAVAVLFSAPVDQPDHAERAVACALEMDAFANAYVVECAEAGVDFGITRIGVHTGEVVVGNFGGSDHFDYRPLGDPINTSSRLETANRHLGTRICVSGATVSACTNFTGRRIGRLLLKGKSTPIDAWEPLAAAESSSKAEYEAAYSRMATEAPDARDAFDRYCLRHPQDGLAQFHRQRLESGEVGDLVVLREK